MIIFDTRSVVDVLMSCRFGLELHLIGIDMFIVNIMHTIRET